MCSVAHMPEEVHVRLVLDEAATEAVRKIRTLLSDLSDALAVLAPDTGLPDMSVRLSDPDAGRTAEPRTWMEGAKFYGGGRIVRADMEAGQPDMETRLAAGQLPGQHLWTQCPACQAAGYDAHTLPDIPL